MANEYLISKWRQWYRSFNVDHSGKVSRKDVDDSENMFAEFHHLSDKQKAEVNREFETWWTEFILRGKSEMTEQEFVDMQNEDFKSDREGYIRKVREYTTTLVSIADLRHEGSITKDEWMFFVQAFGHTNLSAGENFFQSFGPVAGKVQVKKVVDAFVQFTTCEDNSKPDITKNAFDSGFTF